MNRALITVVSVGALTFSVYAVVGGNVPAQTAYLTDAGYTGASHAATCPVRISADCVDAGRQSGLNVHRNERLRFPVAIRTLADGGKDVQLPPMNSSVVGACIEVVDWSDCTLDATAPAVASASVLIGQQLPFDLAGVVRKCVRPHRPALRCLRRWSDGGTWDFGDRNVYPRGEAMDAGDCESVECSVVAGQDPEDPETL